MTRVRAVEPFRRDTFQRAAVPGQTTQKRILIVDDDPSIRDLLALHLSNAGYDVAAAEDGAVAIRMILDAVPDLMIVDVNMPYLNGFELVEALKNDRIVPDVPVIFLSAQENASDRALALGAKAFLKKPVRADTLLTTVARTLQVEQTAGIRVLSDTRKRVLVVDDNRDAANMLSVLIQDMGHVAEVAYDGDSAIALAERFRPDIALVDLVLPDADGCDLANAIRNIDGARCRLFAVTAHSGAEDRLRSVRAGFEDYFVKPFDPQVLEGILSDAQAA